jgi:protein dithiol oxidoreductase (disulfide-forming)
MNRRQVSITLAALSIAGSARAQPAGPVEGTHFSTLREAQPPSIPDKIEVIEFFSYGCPACNAFDPSLERWAANLPADVAFRRIPVPFLANAENFQRTFFALETTGMAAKVHGKVFEAVHVDKRRLLKLDEIVEVVTKAGGDKEKFLSAFTAFSMSSFLARAKSAASNYRIDQIPTLAIAGRYVTSPAQAGGAREALAVASFLIQKARKA